MPFLRLTRDRRGFENTFLLHADHPGVKPRLLYWYRTAPGIVSGRAALDEEAIRTIEEQHPDIDFDWPAILALSEVMTPEEEAPARAPQGQRREKRRRREPDRRGGREDVRAPDDRDVPEDTDDAEELEAAETAVELEGAAHLASVLASDDDGEQEDLPPEPVKVGGLLEELVGREIATRLRARHAEILARIHERDADAAARAAWLAEAERLDPDLWVTPEAILEGVRNADAAFTALRAAVLHSSRE